jgi:hypothetical protein
MTDFCLLLLLSSDDNGNFGRSSWINFSGKREKTLILRMVLLIIIIIGFDGYGWSTPSVFSTDLLFRPNPMFILF